MTVMMMAGLTVVAVVIASVSAAAEANTATVNSIDQPQMIHDQSNSPPAGAIPTTEEPVVLPPAPDEMSPWGIGIIALLAAVACWLLWRRKWLHLPRTERPDPFGLVEPFLFFVGFFVLQVIGATAAVLIASYTGIVSLPGTPAELGADDQLRLGVLQRLGGIALGLPLVIVFLKRLGRHRKQLRLRWPGQPGAAAPPAPGRAIILGLGALVLVYPLASFAANFSTIIIRLLSEFETPTIAHVTLDQMLAATINPWSVMMMLIVIIAAPMFEEIAYRGMIQTAMRGLFRGAWLPIAITSLFFTLTHIGSVQPHALPALFVLSLGFGWIYERTQTLWAPIAMHAGFNLLNLALAFIISPTTA